MTGIMHTLNGSVTIHSINTARELKLPARCWIIVVDDEYSQAQACLTRIQLDRLIKILQEAKRRMPAEEE